MHIVLTPVDENLPPRKFLPIFEMTHLGCRASSVWATAFANCLTSAYGVSELSGNQIGVLSDPKFLQSSQSFSSASIAFEIKGDRAALHETGWSSRVEVED